MSIAPKLRFQILLFLCWALTVHVEVVLLTQVVLGGTRLNVAQVEAKILHACTHVHRDTHVHIKLIPRSQSTAFSRVYWCLFIYDASNKNRKGLARDDVV